MADQNKSYELTDDELDEVVGGTSVEQLDDQCYKCLIEKPYQPENQNGNVVDPNLRAVSFGVVDDPNLKGFAMGVVNAPEAAPKGTMGL